MPATSPKGQRRLNLSIASLARHLGAVRGISIPTPIWRAGQHHSVGTPILDNDVSGPGRQTVCRGTQAITTVVPTWQCGHCRKDRPVNASARSRKFARVNLLILDDWGPEPLTGEQRRDLLELVEDRYNCGSPIITSQVPVDRWYEIVGDPTLADAILDRLVHNSHRIALTGKM